MRFDLPRLAQRSAHRRRKELILRPIQATQAQADALAVIYRRAIERTAPGRERVLAAYERTLAEMQLDSADDVRAALDDLSEEIRRIVLLLTPDLRDWALRIERVHRGKWIRNILSAAAVDLETTLTVGDVAETLAQAIEWNVSLIRDISEEARRRISNAVFSGLQQRKSARDVAKEIREASGVAKARSIRVAGDQTAKLGERLNRARQEQAGLTHFKWRHSGKKHPREHHLARDGQTFPWEGSGIPADDMPGQPPFCGCTAQGVVVFEE